MATKSATLDYAALYYAEHPTLQELDAVLGRKWAVCRKTAKNLARYERCISPAEFKRIEASILAARTGVVR